MNDKRSLEQIEEAQRKLADKKARLAEKMKTEAERLEAAKKVAEARQRKQRRANDGRMKILLGAFTLSRLRNNLTPEEAEKYLAGFEKFVHKTSRTEAIAENAMRLFDDLRKEIAEKKTK